MTTEQVIEALADIKEYYGVTLNDRLYYGYEIQPLTNIESEAIDKAIEILEKLNEIARFFNCKESEKMDSNELLKKTIAINGTNKQLDVAVEELSELIQAVCKIKRYGLTRGEYIDNLAEEIADVSIILDELKIMFDLDYYVDQWQESKIKRLQKRLDLSRERRPDVEDLSE